MFLFPIVEMTISYIRFFIIASTHLLIFVRCVQTEQKTTLFILLVHRRIQALASVENKFISYVHNNFIYCLLSDCMNNDEKIRKKNMCTMYARLPSETDRSIESVIRWEKMNEQDTPHLNGKLRTKVNDSRKKIEYKKSEKRKKIHCKLWNGTTNKKNDNIVLVSLINDDVCWRFSFGSYHQRSYYS